MRLPEFGVGQSIVVTERWNGLLWSAMPVRVITSDPRELVSWVPTGAVSIVATNRELPDAVGMSRSERKLLAMKTCVVQAAEIEEAPDKLHFHRAGRWSRVNLGWDSSDGRFLGWYVNFERPAVGTSSGLESKDLVLDLFVNPDRSWSWKDRDDFDTALAQHVLPDDLEPTLEREAGAVLSDLEAGTGPFDDRWTDFTADASWSVPELPEDYGWGGRRWTFPPGRRVAR